MHAKVFSIQMSQYFSQITLRVCRLVLFINSAVKAFLSCSGTWISSFVAKKEEKDPRSCHIQPSAVPVFPFDIQRHFPIDAHPTRCRNSCSPVED